MRRWLTVLLLLTLTASALAHAPAPKYVPTLSPTAPPGSLGSQSLAYSVNDWLDNDANPNNGSTYFDANGNTTSLDGAWQYDWANRLTNFNNGAATYGYDGDGNRIRKTAGGVTTWYLVATVNPSGWPQVVEEHVSLNSQPSTLNRVYTYGHDLISQSRWTGSAWETHFYLTDGLGSTRALLNPSGNISDSYVYDAFGTLIASSGTTPNDYLFAGEQWDAAIGQYYLRARTLHPGYGRFWTPDTHEGNSSDPLSLHKYLYAHGKPVNMVDPSGLFSFSEVQFAIGARLYLAGQALAAYPRVMAVARSVAATVTLGSLVISDDARAAFLATGNPGAAAASLADDVALLVYRGGRLIQRSASALARSAVMQRVEPALTEASGRIRQVAPDAVIGYRGSVASGIKHSTGGPFDPTDFDLDGFIISDQLAMQLPRKFRDGREIAAIKPEANKIEAMLRGFSGYRSSEGQEFTFRVWTLAEFETIVKKGSYVIVE